MLDALDPERRLLGATPRGPLTLPPGGSHWYVVRELGFPDPETFGASFRLASDWLDGLPVPAERMILGGFSQGAVMSYALGLSAERQRPAGVIALSGFIPTVEGFSLDLERHLPPIAIGHGIQDPVIGVKWSRSAKEQLEQAGADLLYREYPLPHAVDPRFLSELQPWVKRVLPESSVLSSRRGEAGQRAD